MVDISGAWLGTYWQVGVPTRFESTLVQGGMTITGWILDCGVLGEAQVTGAVSGRSIQFTKTYLTVAQGAIAYTGTIAEDEMFMAGVWQIGPASGPWEARRTGDNLTVDQSVLAAKALGQGR